MDEERRLFEGVEEGYPDGEKPVVYYYNREERIAKAPSIVQDYYRNGLKLQKGFRAIFANKSNRFIFISLVAFVAFTWIYTGLNKTRGYATVSNIACELQAFSYERDIYVSIKAKEKKNTKVLPGTVITAQIFFINSDNQVADMKELVLVYESGEEYLRTKIADYDIIRVDAIVTIGEEEKELSAMVTRG